jgi:hypothetical protein
VRAAALKTCLALSAPRHAVGAAAVGVHVLKPLKANAAPTQV